MGSGSHPKKMVQSTHNPLTVMTLKVNTLGCQCWDLSVNATDGSAWLRDGACQCYYGPISAWNCQLVSTCSNLFPSHFTQLFPVSFNAGWSFWGDNFKYFLQGDRWISHTKSSDFQALEIPHHHFYIQIAWCIFVGPCDLTLVSKFCRRKSFKSWVLLIKLAKYTLR